ncbi:MAG: hypothetical protein AB1445_15665 [Bacillota bacterium]
MKKRPRHRDDTLVLLDSPDDTGQLRRQDPKARPARDRHGKTKPGR